MPAPKPYNKAVLGPNPPQQPVPPQAPPRQTPAPQVPQQFAQQHVPPVTQPIYVPRRDNGNGYVVGWRPSRTFWAWASVVMVGLILCIPLYHFIVSVVTANPYPPNTGTLTLNDPLQDNSKGYGWEDDATYDSAGGICQFTGQGYRVRMPKLGDLEYCPARNTDFGNFAFEVQMTIVEGDSGGIFFRAASIDNSNIEYYLFYVDQYGNYELLLATGNTGKELVNPTSSSSIHSGLNQSNLIAVVANGDTITLYVNHQQLASVTDSTYTHGQVGLLASPYVDTSNPSDLGHPTEVIYTNAKVWEL